ncbi:hypothetical protein OSB04_002480 [Centaurea solstitialis]|uniref:Uncharacterized protein n=1 Tax=Centaurea solstitialis TaxID=347529 RepID=A0AA38TUV1_9ASTR|nr:hypothetical protein OSB04_002480 [Centaurea solstitialis]
MVVSKPRPTNGFMTSNTILHPQLHWCIQMKVLFEPKELRDIVKQLGVDELNEFNNLHMYKKKIYIELRKRDKDKKALYIIYQAVDRITFKRISSSESSKEAWDMLYTTYRGEDKVKESKDKQAFQLQSTNIQERNMTLGREQQIEIRGRGTRKP